MTSPPASAPPSAGGRLPVDVPPGWGVARTQGPPGFTTHATLVRPDGARVEWTSRRHRKGLGLDHAAAVRGGRAGALSWWIGGLFAVGATCFAVASLPAVADHVSASTVAWTFAVGSVFFTGAGYLQFHESVGAPDRADRTRSGGPVRRIVARFPRRIDVWATLVQLVGTVLFNVSTFAATRTELSVEHARRLVWSPDVAGSVCFLVASGFAFAEVNPRATPRPDGSVGWWIGALNLVGSVAFGASAVGARILVSTGSEAHVALADWGTFVGAVCFLAGAVLLPVESARDARAG